VVPVVSDDERLHVKKHVVRMRCTACPMEYATVDGVLTMYSPSGTGGFNIIPEGCLLVLGRVPG
jgi:hypothetical protein